MDIMYKSTRGDAGLYTSSAAIIQGLAKDGGLFVPQKFPVADFKIEDLCGMDYKETAYTIMKLFLTDFTEEELRTCIDRAYDDKFDTKVIAPINEADGAYFLELYHGATIAFKDMALSILPHLMSTAAKKNNLTKDIVILTATSGDTGKAALAGFADVKGTKIIVFYPKDGVSPIQKKQMITQKGSNTYVIGVNGNFDDCQSGVKSIFSDNDLASRMSSKGIMFSSANSINIGRLVPQIVYYFYAYTQLVKRDAIKVGQKVNFTVPTGNFGNILAAFYASRLGLPVNKLICASNENRVLFDFFETGIYDRKRKFVLTSSPSMDILISSNLERLIYHICGNDSAKCASLMNMLSSNGEYKIDEQMREAVGMFCAGYSDEDKTMQTIKRVFDSSGYLIDPHTAVAAGVYFDYRNREADTTPTVIVSTASPYKFAGTVTRAIDPSLVSDDDLETADRLSKLSKVPVPFAVTSLKNAKILHTTTCEVKDMKDTVESVLA